MKRSIVTDAEFEVVSGPIHPVIAWQKPRREIDLLAIIRWFYVGLLAIAAGMTALVGLAGGDIDTRDEVAAVEYKLEPGLQPDGTIAVAPVD